MRKALFILFLASPNTLAVKGPIVAHICLVTNPADPEIDFRAKEIAEKDPSTICVDFVPCDKAELVVLVDNSSKMTYYVSKDPGTCK